MPLCFIEPHDAIRVIADSVGREARRQLVGEVVRAWVDDIPDQELSVHYAKAIADLDEDDTFEPRRVIVTTDPMQLTIGNMAYRDLFRPAASVEERIRLVAPFAAMGQRLCDQPPGAHVGHGEL